MDFLQFHTFWSSALYRGNCWVWRSGRFNPSHPWSNGYMYLYVFICISWQGGSEDRSACLETLEERKFFSSKRVLNCDCSHVKLVPTLLYRLSYPEYYMFVYYLYQFYVFAYIHSLWFVPKVTSFSRFYCNCTTERRYLSGHSRDRWQLEREKLSDDLCDG